MREEFKDPLDSDSDDAVENRSFFCHPSDTPDADIQTIYHTLPASWEEALQLRSLDKRLPKLKLSARLKLNQKQRNIVTNKARRSEKEI
jgi:hypothetical protein